MKTLINGKKTLIEQEEKSIVLNKLKKYHEWKDLKKYIQDVTGATNYLMGTNER